MDKKGEQFEAACIFCSGTNSSLALDLHDALLQRHARPPFLDPEQPIQILARREPPETSVERMAWQAYREAVDLDAVSELCKRYYWNDEYERKAEALLEYYKYHINSPQVVGAGVEGTMRKYYERKGKVAYKEIQAKLRGEGVHITTIPESQMTNSQAEIRSHYSSFISYLDTVHQDSVRLWQICGQIDRAYHGEEKLDKLQIKGEFKKNSSFDAYVQREESKTRHRLLLQKRQNQGQVFFNNKLLKNAHVDQGVQTMSKSVVFRTPTRSSKRQPLEGFAFLTNIKSQLQKSLKATIQSKSKTTQRSPLLIQRSLKSKSSKSRSDFKQSQQRAAKVYSSSVNLQVRYTPTKSKSKKKNQKTPSQRYDRPRPEKGLSKSLNISSKRLSRSREWIRKEETPAHNVSRRSLKRQTIETQIQSTISTRRDSSKKKPVLAISAVTSPFDTNQAWAQGMHNPALIK